MVVARAKLVVSGSKLSGRQSWRLLWEASRPLSLGVLAMWDRVIEVPREAALQSKAVFTSRVRLQLQWDALVRQVTTA